MGGMQRVSMQWVEAFSKRSSVTLVPKLLHAHWKGIGLQTAFFLLKLWIRLPGLVKRYRADVVVFSSMVTASLAPLMTRRVKVPMVAINHGLDVTIPVSAYQWWVKKVFSSLSATISVSKATREACLDRGMPPESAYVIPNGLEVSTNSSLLDRSAQRDRVINTYGLREDLPILLSVGRQVRRKGHQWFIEQVLPLLSQPVQCIFVGDGPERSTIEAAIRTSPAQHKIILTGKVEDDQLHQLYAGSDVFIMPNIPVPGDMEGFGIVMLEANQAGLPVVATRLEGIVDVIEEGVNGITCEPLQPQTFAEQLDGLLRHLDRFEPTKIRDYVHHTFSWDAVADQYEHVIKEVTTKNRP